MYIYISVCDVCVYIYIHICISDRGKGEEGESL